MLNHEWTETFQADQLQTRRNPFDTTWPQNAAKQKFKTRWEMKCPTSICPESRLRCFWTPVNHGEWLSTTIGTMELCRTLNTKDSSRSQRNQDNIWRTAQLQSEQQGGTERRQETQEWNMEVAASWARAAACCDLLELWIQPSTRKPWSRTRVQTEEQDRAGQESKRAESWLLKDGLDGLDRRGILISHPVISNSSIQPLLLWTAKPAIMLRGNYFFHTASIFFQQGGTGRHWGKLNARRSSASAVLLDDCGFPKDTFVGNKRQASLIISTSYKEKGWSIWNQECWKVKTKEKTWCRKWSWCIDPECTACFNQRRLLLHEREDRGNNGHLNNEGLGNYWAAFSSKTTYEITFSAFVSKYGEMQKWQDK